MKPNKINNLISFLDSEILSYKQLAEELKHSLPKPSEQTTKAYIVGQYDGMIYAYERMLSKIEKEWEWAKYEQRTNGSN